MSIKKFLSYNISLIKWYSLADKVKYTDTRKINCIKCHWNMKKNELYQMSLKYVRYVYQFRNVTFCIFVANLVKLLTLQDKNHQCMFFVKFF